MAMAMNFSKPVTKNRRNEAKEQLFRTRKSILKHLVWNFLKTEGYRQSAELFAIEASVPQEYQLCDNVDIEIMFQDYCNYYHLKFNKQPIFIKRVDHAPAKPLTTGLGKKSASKISLTPSHQTEEAKPAPIEMHMTVQQIGKQNKKPESKPSRSIQEYLALLVPEKRELAEPLYSEVVHNNSELVRWSDVIGLDEAKALLMESVIYPIKRPELFDGLLKPWKGILLHGPPGGGKTMLAKAVAEESDGVFFNVSPNIIINKWRGESEKIVKLIFSMAHFMAPSIIFIDEIDSVASTRGADTEHEASRRLKSQLLTEIDGMETQEGNVFVLVNSNLPWLIDPALLRRLEKRIHVPLPDRPTREAMLLSFLSHSTIQLDNDINFGSLADKTEGYSGSDLRVVCKEALMGCLRKVLNGDKRSYIGGDQSKPEYKIKQKDLLSAINKTRPVSKELMEKHSEWQTNMGSC